MRHQYNDALETLIDAFAKLPSIGRKSATRLEFHLLEGSYEEAEALAKAIIFAKRKIKPCKLCYNLTDSEYCKICQDETRDKGTLCVVESARELEVLERSGAFRGRYHVLGGSLSPIKGIAPENLRIDELLKRLQDEAITELILATNASLEGEATAFYINDLLKNSGIKITRIAQGLPMGGDIKYTDEMTLARAFLHRQEIS